MKLRKRDNSKNDKEQLKLEGDIGAISRALDHCEVITAILRSLKKSGNFAKDFPVWLFERGKFELAYERDRLSGKIADGR